ncbi:MAG TPA: secondary thiamine-phosphate synthase enzyme YjbQ [Fimbriimonadaceae bacterium]|nr:secondary thiamine-phosphate synthase enzyme YjbQ [Fimbriimonadaceae bacterium]
MSAVIRVSTSGEGDMRDMTDSVAGAVRQSGVRDGIVTAFVIGSTAAITTIEFEPGLREDMPAALERVAPRDAHYAHEATWHDDNGHSHIRASMIGPSLTVPVVDGRLTLGTWQQIVLLEFDTRPRDRQVVVQVIGERR